MANIEPLFNVAQELTQLGAPDDTHIHLCVYHSRFPLALRSEIEHQLDTAFNRRGDPQSVYRLPTIRAAINAHDECNHLFVVLASPVCEVGRDWDADWAVAEPSSMRSLIQLAGRVQRHRGKAGEKPNVLIFDTNLNYFLKASADRNHPPPMIYVRPGFENDRRDQDGKKPFRLLPKRRLGSILKKDEYAQLCALPRILPRAELQSTERLVDLEQARMMSCMLPRNCLPDWLRPDENAAMENYEAARSWQHPQAALTGMLPQQQPFRDDPDYDEALVFLPDDGGEELILHRVVTDKTRYGKSAYILENGRCHGVNLQPGPRITPWANIDLLPLLVELAEQEGMELRRCAEKFAIVEVPKNDQGWHWHEWLGFNKKQ